MNTEGEIRMFNTKAEIPVDFVHIKNGDVLKHTEHDRYFLIISISEEKLVVQPISNAYAKELELKRAAE